MPNISVTRVAGKQAQSGEQESQVNPVSAAGLWCDWAHPPPPFIEGLGRLAAEDP